MIFWLGLPGSLTDLINRIPLGWSAAILLAVALGSWLIYRKGYVVVPERQVAVVCNPDTHDFSRFLAPGQHRLVPGKECIRAAISTDPIEIENCCEARTREGILINLEWKLSYRFDLLNYDLHHGVENICSIVNKARRMVLLHTSDSARELFAHYPSTGLWEDSIQNRIKRQLAKLIAEKVHPYGVLIEWVEIQVPPKVEARQLARLVRTIRVNRGDLSKDEIEQLTHLDVIAPPELDRDSGVPRTHSEARIALQNRERSNESDNRDTFAHIAVYNIDIPGDDSIGRIVV